MFKRIFALYLFTTVLFLPAYAFGNGDVPDGHTQEASSAATVDESQPHGHDANSAHGEGFTLTGAFSGRWWIFLGVSLILMGMLSMGVQKYLHTDYPEGKDPMRFSMMYFVVMTVLLVTLILYGSGKLEMMFP